MKVILIFLAFLILKYVCNTQSSIGYIYINHDPSNAIILAESQTLSSYNMINITICSTLVPQSIDLQFTWIIEPPNTERFLATEGFASISKLNNSTQIQIGTRNTHKSNLYDLTYFFRLDHMINVNEIDSMQKFFFNLSARSVPVHLLPSNYPFGLFEFSKKNTKYLTVSRYSCISEADSIRIDRKFGSDYRVLIEYEQLELNINSTSVIKYIHFESNQLFSTLNFSLAYENDRTDRKYPRNFILKLNAAYLLDSIPEITENKKLIAQTNSILPAIGNFSTINITVIDDKSIIELTDTDLTVKSVYKTSVNLTVSITRSALSSLNRSVLIKFLTVPLYSTDTINGIEYYPARAFLDYSPVNGQFIFLPNMQSANFTFQIYQNDDDFAYVLNRKFRIYLLDIDNCDGCQLGFKTQANVLIQVVNEPFRRFLAWNDLTVIINSTIYLSPASQLNKICLDNLSEQSIRITLNLTQSSDINTNELVLRPNYNGSLDRLIHLNPFSKKNCIQFTLFSLNPIDSSNISMNEYCFSFNYFIQFQTSFILDENKNVYSPVVSSDIFRLNIFNWNCALSVSFITNYMLINNYYYESKINSSSLSIDLSTNESNDYLIKIPLNLSLNKNLTKLNQLDAIYQINIDPELTSYVANEVNVKSSFTIDTTAATNYFTLQLKNIRTFPFYLLSLNISLLTNTSSLGLYKLVNPMFIQIGFITKVLGNTTCGIISLNKKFSCLNSLESDRLITLTFNNDLPSSTCVINTLYSIDYVNKKSLTLSDNIYKFIPTIAQNFYFQFTPFGLSQKQVPINRNVYIDTFNGFLVNITSLKSVQSGSIAYVKSLTDSRLVLEASVKNANGPAYLTSNLYYQLNLSNPFRRNDYDLKININLNRQATFSTCRANLELLLIDESSRYQNSSSKSNLATNDGIAQIVLALDNGQANKSIDFDIRDLISDSSSMYADLVLFGNICFFSSDNLNVYCAEQNSLLSVEPDGLFSFSNNTTYLSVINNDLTLTNSIEYQVQRKFGSLNNVSLYYALASLNSLTDFFFQTSSIINSIQFKSGQVIQNFTLDLNPVMVMAQRDFYVYLTNTQTVESSIGFETRKISKNNYFAQISILPFKNFIDTVVFTRSKLMLPLTLSGLTFTIDIFRIGFIVSNTVTFCLKSAGLNETIPNYILANLTADQRRHLAYSEFDYEPVNKILQFTANDSFLSISLSIKTNSFGRSKYFYLYLSEPENGARLIEPYSNTIAYAPFICIELRYTPLLAYPGIAENSNNLTQKLTIGFVNINQTIDLMPNFKLDLVAYPPINESNQLVNQLYELKWTAQIITPNNSNLKINDIIKCGLFEWSSLECGHVINCNSFENLCSLVVEFKTSTHLLSDYLIRFQLFTFESIHFPTNYLLTQIESSTGTTYLTINSNSKYKFSVGFEKDSLLSLNNKLRLDTYLKVYLKVKQGNHDCNVTVSYRSEQIDPIWFNLNGNIRIYSAHPGYDYEPTIGSITFTPGTRLQSINVKLSAAAILDNRLTQSTLYPRMFKVILFDCQPDCNITSYVSNVTILADDFDLWRVYREALNDNPNTNLNEIQQISLKPDANITSMQSDLIIETLKEILSKENELISSSQLDKTLNILCNLMASRSLNGIHKYFNLLEDALFTFSALNRSDLIRSNLTNVTFDLYQLKCSLASFNFIVNQVEPMNKLRFASYSSQSVQVDVNFTALSIKKTKEIIHFENISSNLLNSDENSLNICLIELFNVNWLNPSNSLLNGRAILFSTRSSNSNNLPDIYSNSSYQMNPIRIRLFFSRAIQTNKQCAIFNPSLSEWQFDLCQTSKGYNYVDCNCFHQSIYGLVSEPDSFYYGFDHTWFYIVVSCLMAAALSAFITYFLCSNVYSYSSFCLIQFLAAIGFAQLLYLLTVAISSKVIVDEPSKNNSSCIVLSLFFHYFILSQFTWIFSISLLYYLIFVKNLKNTFNFKLGLILLAWSLPILIIAIFYLITGILFEYMFNYSAAFVYTDVLDNKEICFIKNFWAYLGGVILPCSVLFLISLVLQSVMFKRVSKWNDSDDIYLKRLNKKEIQLNIILWLVLFLVNLWASIQIRYGYLWLFIVFCIFDIILAVFIVYFYTFQRHISQIHIFHQEKKTMIVSRESFNLINTEHTEPKSSTEDSTINNNSLTSDLNRLVDIFKTSSSMDTIDSSLKAHLSQHSTPNKNDLNTELSDLKFLLDAKKMISSSSNEAIQIQEIKYDQDRDELETEISNSEPCEFEEKLDKKKKPQQEKSNRFCISRAALIKQLNDQLEEANLTVNDYENIFEISSTQV